MTNQTLKGQISYSDHERANVYLDINNKVQDIFDGKNVNLPNGWHYYMSSKKTTLATSKLWYYKTATDMQSYTSAQT